MSKHHYTGERNKIQHFPTDRLDLGRLQQEDTCSPSPLLSSGSIPGCLLFDLDGVLIDTRQVIVKALCYVADILKVHIHAEKELLAAAVMSPRKAVEALFPQHTHALSLLREGIKLYVPDLSPCPGILELLEVCMKEPIAVVTSRNQIEADFFLTNADLHRFFSVVVTWGHTSRHKPRPDPLILAARQLGRTTGIYIGDTPSDMVAAKAGGFYPIGAVWASQWSNDQLIAAGAAFVAAQPSAVLAHLQG